jgi:hypothetical protein
LLQGTALQSWSIQERRQEIIPALVIMMIEILVLITVTILVLITITYLTMLIILDTLIYSVTKISACCLFEALTKESRIYLL